MNNYFGELNGWNDGNLEVNFIRVHHSEYIPGILAQPAFIHREYSSLPANL